MGDMQSVPKSRRIWLASNKETRLYCRSWRRKQSFPISVIKKNDHIFYMLMALFFSVGFLLAMFDVV
ncbi:MAG: hypothetical protein EU981_01995 [Candidatus Liberibacter ctenarytainae]|uniref:Transmembrane protein n=1 Tax=Candidatus Liberibacter ctenarytainae TaxID=2020335 RepID=A0A937DIY8_9HYPH|nr:hypothetical protein [Candidatus Liberibacter ctenarytainae]